MDKNAIKKYAVWARNELIARVTQKAEQYEITEKKTTPAEADSIGGRLLSEAEKKQRAALIEKIKTDGFEQVMEEVAYTWFNRFTALRFMEVNNYLPSHTRVFTNEAGEFKPQILTDAIQLDLEGLNMDKVFELKDANKTEELYKYLLITQCNALSSVLPRMFQKIAHYTELLLPDYLLREGSVIEQMIALIPEEDWTDQVQIIGWLYQFYNIEPKDKAFAELKKKKKITKETIPAITQLFTPDWIVRYMVENSLGRLWLEGHTNDNLKSEWKYYLEETAQEDSVQKQIDELRKEYAVVKPEEIRCIDPCMGSGHILCYMFDLLIKIYEDYGYSAREAVSSIVQNNLWGLDIDERASQLAYFAVMMKARQYDRRFFSKGIQPNVYSINESNDIQKDLIDYFCQEDIVLSKDINDILKSMHNAKTYGSLIEIGEHDWNRIYKRFEALNENPTLFSIQADIELKPIVDSAHAISQVYDICITNPPYMGSSGMDTILSDFIKKYYFDSKADLCACFMERVQSYTKPNGFYSMITQHGWMFLSSYATLRNSILHSNLINMAHLGARAFDEIAGEVVQTTSFVIRKKAIRNYKGCYSRVVDATSQDLKEEAFLSGQNNHYISSDLFEKIPGEPVVYWLSPKVMDVFNNPSIEDYVLFRQGMATSDNNRFLRLWFEVSQDNSYYDAHDLDSAKESGCKWFAYNKGGSYRKWYGNTDYVVNWENDGEEMKAFTATLTQGMNVRLKSREYYFKECYSWSKISTGQIAFRYYPDGFAFDVAGCCVFNCGSHLKYFLGLSNSVVTSVLAGCLSPTLNYELDHLKKIPVIIDAEKEPEIRNLVDQNIELCRREWDSYEMSWNYERHPLIQKVDKISEAYKNWEKLCNERFLELKENEEKLNAIFLDIYGLTDELDASVSDESISIRHSDLTNDIKSFISYAVGCMFGRYSLDVDGLVYAGGKWDPSSYRTFIPDKDAIIPICDDEYFDDDIVGRFVEFVGAVFGKDALEENLRFIADALGGKGSSREVIRAYFINDFYSDHIKLYQKRPIYWLFDSGKKNGFKCLVYMHRYQADTIARIRTDYVHEQQSRYRTAISDLEQRISSAATSERVKLNKMLSSIQAQADEIRTYEEKIHHLADQMIKIDLDDGVKHNYELFADVLAKM